MSWFSWSLHCSLINIEPGPAAKHNPANDSHHSRENTSTFLKLIGSIMAQFTSREKKQEDSNLSFTDQFNMSFWHSSGLQLPVQLMSVGIKVLTWASRGGKCCCCKICPMWLRVKELRKCEKGDLKGQEEWQMISYMNSRKWDGNRKDQDQEGDGKWWWWLWRPLMIACVRSAGIALWWTWKWRFSLRGQKWEKIFFSSSSSYSTFLDVG